MAYSCVVRQSLAESLSCNLLESAVRRRHNADLQRRPTCGPVRRVAVHNAARPCVSSSALGLHHSPSKSPARPTINCRDLCSSQRIAHKLSPLQPFSSCNTPRSHKSHHFRAALAGTAEKAVTGGGRKPRNIDRKPLVGPGETRTCDVVVVGSGIGGLSCAGLLARYGEVSKTSDWTKFSKWPGHHKAFKETRKG
jgi:hypothetical protein